jgi:hypothetical protein
MFGSLSRTPPQHPVHGPFDLVGYSCWLLLFIPFHTSKEVWVTDGIFFNGVVPWEILIIVLF